MSHEPVKPQVASQPVPRRAWVRPVVSKMKAGDAELGPNPDNPDGGFTFS